MKKKAEKPAPKKRGKYDKPLIIDGSFDEVIKVAMRDDDKPKKGK